MSEHQKQTAFLQQCLLYDDTVERQRLEENIVQLQRNERCLRRAVWVMAWLIALAMASLCYSAIFLTDHPQNMSQFFTQFISKVFCALGLGSLICLVSFVGLGVIFRKELDQRREECRRRAAKLLESRLGKPRSLGGAGPEISSEQSMA
jgi:hypothetical protein